MAFWRPEMCVVSVCVCVSMRNKNLLCLPQAVCCRRSWRLILPALSGVFRPPHQQVREKGFHLTRTNCSLLFLSYLQFFLTTHVCALKVIYQQIKGDSQTSQDMRADHIQTARVYHIHSLWSSLEGQRRGSAGSSTVDSCSSVFKTKLRPASY